MAHSRYNIGSSTDTNYSFLSVTGDTLRYKGYLTPDNNLTFHHQKPIIFFPYFPYTYGYTCADSPLSYYKFNSTSYDTVFTIYSFKVTGYGTLLLPGNRTYNNVLQITRKNAGNQ